MPVIKAALVSIFWDLENCHPPSRLSVNVVVDRIRRVAGRYGRVTAFDAYGDFTLESPKQSLRTRLRNSGVSLHDCRHNGRKNVVDAAIIGDMSAFVKGYLVLLSGDHGFSPTISVLSRHGCKTVVIAPSGASSEILKRSAFEVLDWDGDILSALPSNTSSAPLTTLSAAVSSTQGVTSTKTITHGRENTRSNHPTVPEASALSIHRNPRLPKLVLPRQFQQLVVVLEKHRRAGNLKPRWDVVAQGLKGRKATYKSAGVSTFSKFAQRAVEAKGVSIGGEKNNYWISLLPKWCTKVQVV